MAERRKRNILTVTAVAAFATVLALNPCDMFSGSSKDLKKGERSMNTALALPDKAVPIPPMDATAPAQTEAATFALG